MENKFVASKSNIEGRGIFASSSIKAGETICIMKGEKLSISQLRKKYKSGQERISDPLQIDDTMYLDLEEPYIFFNHSCLPNGAVVDNHRLIAIRDIDKGEEITYDYSSVEWTDGSFTEWTDPKDENYQKWLMVCSCGAPSCRKNIGDFTSLPEDKKKYYTEHGLVQRFILRKYQGLVSDFRDCQFCDNPDIQSRLIYQDDLIIVFPTNIPITPGHTIICPAKHIAKIDELSDRELLAIKSFLIKLKISLKKSLGAEGFNIAWNEGETAGQAVNHLHIHVVPRKTGDQGIYQYDPRQFLYRPGSRSISPDRELWAMAELIKKNI